MGVVQSLWTEDMTATVKELWFKEDWSAERIAEHINRTHSVFITRNAVISKAHRSLGGAAKAVRVVGSGNLVAKPRPPKPRHTPHAKPRPPVEPLPPDDILIGVTLMDLEDNCCRWVCEPADEPIYCGRQKTEGKPYCAAHAIRAKAQPRSRPRTRIRWKMRIDHTFRPG
jgi:hypothetical protein